MAASARSSYFGTRRQVRAREMIEEALALTKSVLQFQRRD